ncbi:NACHT domain-containing protein [Reyranella sp.]|uniref:NACHT domain-containing protein n=1 Tax=Reyranella sp. TaxID=1929291 RepID=UPI003BA9865E
MKALEELEEKRTTDKVRASRDGHAYHEAWAARSALELLPPRTTLDAIALEGFSIEDDPDLGDEAVEVADLVRYHGAAGVARASRVEVVQFKYSISRADTPIRAADLVKTLQKFTAADADFRVRHGASLVERVVRYDFASNRPVHENLYEAIKVLRSGAKADGDIARQVEQLREALHATGIEIASFLGRLELTGSRGSLKQVDRSIQKILATWGEADDSGSRTRLLKLRNLVRSKVGIEGAGNNLIDRVAVLAELGVDDERTLYPTPDAFPALGHVVSRAIVDRVLEATKVDPLPLVIHAAGGMGKTVLMQSVAKRLSDTNHVVVFDGFGAGQWRDPADGRHRPDKTLVHLANLLAGQGMCDILLPISDETDLIRAFRRRLVQAVSGGRQAFDESGVILILDAIDHAAIQAEATGTRSFAHLLLKSLSVNPIGGVFVVASCRTERLAASVGGATIRAQAIPPFSTEEARALILARDPTAQSSEIAALEGRSGRNPRCLDAFLAAGRPYDGPRPGGEAVTSSDVLDALLRERIENAREAARVKGATDASVDTLLSGLSILPPPVPIAELAAVHGLSLPEVESFAADLSPLLERTPHGLTFRDEPTETLILRLAQHDHSSRDRVIQNLLERQSQSDYAARALPVVLTALHYADMLIELAFDQRVPPSTSKVGQRDIRLARIVAALEICALAGRYDDLMRLLMEAAVVAAGHQRSDRFLYEFPDLTGIAGDSEAMRRLSATKIGWPGGRHSSLALANVFAGEVDEAQRNARRSIDWYNWAIRRQSQDDFGHQRIPADRDDTGFSYVEMLLGDDKRIARWISGRPASAAFAKFDNLFDLLERHIATAGADFKAPRQLLSRIVRCRVPASAFWAAALRYSTGHADRDGQLLARLVAALESDAEDDFPSSALHAAVARAIGLGRRWEARAILKAASTVRPQLYSFTSQWRVDCNAENMVTAAALTAAVRGTSPTLVDIAPQELVALVPPSVRARGPRAFANYLDEYLTDTVSKPRKKHKQRKPKLNHENRHDYKRAIEHRLSPLIAYAKLASMLVSLPPGLTVPLVMNRALDKLEADAASTSTFPYPDGKVYISRTGFSVIFRVVDAIGGLDLPTATRMIAWLKTAPGFFAPFLTQVVARLSRVPKLHNAALELAIHVETLIVADTDTSSRISAYGELARAVWRVSSDEAAAYFRRGLDLADAIGSDDFDRTGHLLELTGNYRGAPLPPVVVHDLARIFELNQHEDEKFPWVDYGNAMSSVGGLAALAIAGRLDDRGKSDLGLSLPPLLTALTSDDKISADLASCLFGLVEPIETWSWRLSVFVKAALKGLAANQREWLFSLILIEIDRAYLLAPLRETIHELHLLAQAHLAPNSPALSRIEAIAARRSPPENASNARVPTDYVLSVTNVVLGDPDALDRAIESESKARPGHRSPQRTLQGLSLLASTPKDRIAFVEAVAKASAADLSEKLFALEPHIRDWARLSPALRDRLPEIASILAERHAPELVGHSWEADFGWRHLINSFNGNRSVLTTRVVVALRAIATEVKGDSWLALAAKLAPVVGHSAFRRGLERFITLTGATLPAEVGDGPWDERHAVGKEPPDVVAGFIWSRLGNYKAASRWRAAHAVRRLVSVGRFDVVDRLVARFDEISTPPFCDAKLPFYVLHARLWLLIALARIAKDNPREIARYRTLLERIAFGEEFPHVVMRAFAVDGLREMLKLLDAVEAATLRAKLAAVNASSLPRTPRTGARVGHYAERPTHLAGPANQFHLDYDFDKDTASSLGRIFDCGTWEIQDGITQWVRRWDTSIRGMYDCPRIGKGNYDIGTWRSTSLPEADRYGGYLGWHALMLVAGEMLRDRPIAEPRWDHEPWAEFLQYVTLSRADGLWLSDASDLTPIDLVTSLPMPDIDTKGMNQQDQKILSPLLGIVDGRVPTDTLVVSGHWSLPEDVTITVRSVLASRAEARAIVLATLTDRKFSHWLPHDEDDVERQFGENGHSVLAWLKPNDHGSRMLDRHDPYGAPTAMSRPSPENWLLEQAAIKEADSIVRSWNTVDGTVFLADAWGATGGQGDRRWNESGERIKVSTTFLCSLLAIKQKVLVGFVQARRFVPNKSKRASSDTGAFTHRVMMFILDKNGKMRVVSRISKKTQLAVAAIAARDRTEFRARFSALRPK